MKTSLKFCILCVKYEHIVVIATKDDFYIMFHVLMLFQGGRSDAEKFDNLEEVLESCEVTESQIGELTAEYLNIQEQLANKKRELISVKQDKAKTFRNWKEALSKVNGEDVLNNSSEGTLRHPVMMACYYRWFGNKLTTSETVVTAKIAGLSESLNVLNGHLKKLTGELVCLIRKKYELEREAKGEDNDHGIGVGVRVNMNQWSERDCQTRVLCEKLAQAAQKKNEVKSSCVLKQKSPKRFVFTQGYKAIGEKTESSGARLVQVDANKCVSGSEKGKMASGMTESVSMNMIGNSQKAGGASNNIGGVCKNRDGSVEEKAKVCRRLENGGGDWNKTNAYVKRGEVHDNVKVGDVIDQRKASGSSNVGQCKENSVIDEFMDEDDSFLLGVDMDSFDNGKVGKEHGSVESEDIEWDGDDALFLSIDC